ncbi:hypothetical protein Q1695_002029 [Nippostrongylus brasiliensis]|nr:hypothetical protein Q1695_002029 [Nippostrongylus brasiliensis]
MKLLVDQQGLQSHLFLISHPTGGWSKEASPVDALLDHPGSVDSGAEHLAVYRRSSARLHLRLSPPSETVLLVSMGIRVRIPAADCVTLGGMEETSEETTERTKWEQVAKEPKSVKHIISIAAAQMIFIISSTSRLQHDITGRTSPVAVVVVVRHPTLSKNIRLIDFSQKSLI